jgi:serine/threonine-protein kinase
MVLDRYRAVEHIANGGHSVVYLGRDERLARPVCIKVFTRFPGDPGISQTSYEHFVQEAFALSRLPHPNTLRIYDFGQLAGDPASDPSSDEDEKIPFHVSEYMNGGTLSQLVRELGSQPVPEVVRIARAIADALAEAHSVGIIHRDLKPQNILFASLGGTKLPKLADFGIAKWLEDRDADDGSEDDDDGGRSDGREGGFARAGDTQVVSGQKMAMYSPSWAAPEQLAGQTVGPSADIYSLALMAIYMLTGRAIFTDDDVYEGYRKRKNAASIVELALEKLVLPRSAVELLQQATCFDPASRPQRAAEFGIALAEAFDESRNSVLETAKLAKLEVISEEAARPAPVRAAARGTRRVSVAPGTVDVAGRNARFAPIHDGHADVAGLGGTARLRFTFSAAHTERQVRSLAGAVAPLLRGL